MAAPPAASCDGRPVTRGAEGRVVLITGGAAGIGWATAQLFAAAGDRVVVADIDGMAAERRAAALGPGHGFIVADMGDPDAPAPSLLVTVKGNVLKLDAHQLGRIRAGGGVVVATDQTRVRTSARTDNRVPGGFGGYLRRLAAGLVPLPGADH